MDILKSEPNKRALKWGVAALRKILGKQANVAAIHDDIINCGNLGIRYLANLNLTTAEFVKCDHQKNIQLELVELFLWFVYKDTAWRDQFFYDLDEMLKNADEIRALIKPYVKQPKDWHVNNWMESKEITAKDIADGKVLRGSVSMAESVHVPPIQRQRLSQIATKQIKR